MSPVQGSVRFINPLIHCNSGMALPRRRVELPVSIWNDQNCTNAVLFVHSNAIPDGRKSKSNTTHVCRISCVLLLHISCVSIQRERVFSKETTPVSSVMTGCFEKKNSSMELAMIWGNSDISHSDFTHSDFTHSDFTHSDFTHSDFSHFFITNSYFFHLTFTTWELI